ncbi:TPA: hypothetical protein I7682_17720 [Vibrio vulnificus]|nr:hypothetical protein [Vibrio vulnificus]
MRKQFTPRRKKNAGITTIEFMTTLAIIGLALVFIWRYGDELMIAAKVQITKFQVSQIASAVQEHTQGGIVTGTRMTDIADILPQWIGDGSNATLFGGDFQLTDGATPFEYNIQATGTPNQAGAKLTRAYDSSTYDAGTETWTVTLGE